jgi:hypothetical protein
MKVINLDNLKKVKEKLEFLENKRFTKKQNEIYSLALYGMKYYNQNPELKKSYSIDEVKFLHSNTQKSINKLKQKRVNYLCTKLCKGLFYNSPLAECLLTPKKINIDLSYFNTLLLKDLGIDKEMIISQLIHDKIINENFYKL